MRRIVTAVVVLLALHAVALAGLAGYAGWKGMLTHDCLRSAAVMLRGQADVSLPPSVRPTPAPADAGAASPKVPLSEERVFVWQEALARREREIADQWSLLRTAQLQVLRDREALEAERKALRSTTERNENPADKGGSKKEIEYLSSIRPRQGREFLRQKKDADAVEIMLAIEPRIGRKIIDACKTQEERLWMGRILEQLRQRSDRQAEVLAAGAS